MKFKLVEIETLEKVHYSGTVHDLTVEDDHSYTVNNIIVHNSVCETRIKTGFGVPQLTAIMDCAKCGKPIIADGGMRTPGDIVKALAAGATMVMVGGMLAGTDETPGEIITETETKYKIFRGMASREAYEEFFGSAMPTHKTSEGISTTVPCKGPVEDVINDIVGGLRSGMTYCGSRTLEMLRNRADFIEVSHSTRMENIAHHAK